MLDIWKLAYELGFRANIEVELVFCGLEDMFNELLARCACCTEDSECLPGNLFQ